MKKSVSISLISAGAVSIGDHVVFEPESYSGKIEDIKVKEEHTLSFEKELVFTIGERQFTRNESDSVPLTTPLTVESGELDGNGEPITISDILLLETLETVNVAGGVVENELGYLSYIDETEAEWPDLANNAESIFDYLSKTKKIKLAHLVVQRLTY